jgi:hypothetical protein
MDYISDAVFRQWVDAFRADPVNAPQPVDHFLDVMTARANLLISEGLVEAGRRDLRLLDGLREVIAQFRAGTASYAEAAQVSTWEHATIAKKACSQGGKAPEIRTVNGRVYLSELPISPRKAPFAHGIAAMDRMAEAARVAAREEVDAARAEVVGKVEAAAAIADTKERSLTRRARRGGTSAARDLLLKRAS